MSNVINYDETCFTDDPGRSKVVVKKTSKHPERVCDTTKTSISVMFAVSADGKMLPQYVVYKSDHLWSTWVEGGPEGCHYNRSSSGWFDQNLFEDWFFKVIVPHCRKLVGKKILIGDNLASHISERVVRGCQENNIIFTLLPPNSTHLMQPLDVSCFRPIKSAWRRVLQAWKRHNKGSLRKDIFPRLLKAALGNVEAANPINIKSGFSSSGIFPVDREKVLKKIPHPTENSISVIAESVESVLRDKRYGSADKPKTGKRKKINIEPGESVTLAKFCSQSDEELPQTPRMFENNDITEIESEIDTQQCVEETDIQDFYEKTATNLIQSHPITQDLPKIADINKDDFIQVKFVTVKNNLEIYVGRVLSKNRSNVTCNFLRKCFKSDSYVFPNVEDISEITIDQILKKLEVKSLRRGRYEFK